ncbi:MAG: hypothetical protein ACR2IF_03935 [Terriglobales bacterium]
MIRALSDYYRCSDELAETEASVTLPAHIAAALQSSIPHPGGFDRALPSSECEELIAVLRNERYVPESKGRLSSGWISNFYYALRPVLGVQLRRSLQRLFLRGWQDRPFPRWPVDRTVDELHQQMLLSAMKASNIQHAPFIWFWPDGHSACAVMTHDVETEKGLQFCPELMDMDDAAGMKASFQIIPEQRYRATGAQLDAIRRRGFEVNVHDLNHDGKLFRDRAVFESRVDRLNSYGERFRAAGFRSGALYRNQSWFRELKFAYDMSVPNVAHLDPQHGGCCTLLPFFIGNVVEIPVTAIQDYSLFHILQDYSTELWQRQLSTIVAQHGVINVIAHPDYLLELRARSVYQALLAYMAGLRDKNGVWTPLPGEVNTWWRQRAQMKLVQKGADWAITGAGQERAQIAYAEANGDGLCYRLGT